jgi:prevent-host-death family protein
MRVISQRELRNDSARVLREVEAGETLIVARSGVPVAELRPAGPRRFVPRATIARAAPHAARVDFVRLRAELTAVVDAPSDPSNPMSNPLSSPPSTS